MIRLVHLCEAEHKAQSWLVTSWRQQGPVRTRLWRAKWRTRSKRKSALKKLGAGGSYFTDLELVFFVLEVGTHTFESFCDFLAMQSCGKQGRE